MNANSFDLIAQEMLKQQQVMQQIETENRELRRQIAELRQARGIFVEICGQRFAVGGEVLNAASSSMPLSATASSDPAYASAEAPTIEIAKPSVAEENTPVQRDEQKTGQPSASTFLEEIMIDEFASASTNPMAVWSGTPKPSPTKGEESIDEDEKATLRRELMGSFLLE